MIINLEIDDELAAQVEAAARARGVTARDFMRDALRQAAAAPVPTSSKTTFFQKVHDFGADFDSSWTRLAEIESEEYVRKLARK